MLFSFDTVEHYIGYIDVKVALKQPVHFVIVGIRRTTSQAFHSIVSMIRLYSFFK
jgi:hypothetical protein